LKTAQPNFTKFVVHIASDGTALHHNHNRIKIKIYLLKLITFTCQNW